MFLIKSHQNLPQRERLRREERPRKPFFVQKHKNSFSQSFFSLCNLPWGKVSPHKNKKRFSSSFFSLWKLSFRQILMNFDLGHFTFFSQSFILCIIYPEGRSVRINTQKVLSQSFFPLWKLSLRQILKNFHLEHFMFFSLSLFSLCGSTS